MINSPELPRVIAMVIAGGAVASQPSGNLTIQEIVPQVATWIFPQPLPPVNVVAILLGGMGIYTTQFRLIAPDGHEIATANGPDVPFTTQIKRFNLAFPMIGITAEPVVTVPGSYRVELLIRGTVVAHTPLEIFGLPGPPPGFVMPPSTNPPSN